jgi:four helix bundle protein
MARRVEELDVFRLGNELREKVHAITATSPANRDRKFCTQLDDAASSVTRNICEGFGRYRHKEFAQFLSIARGSVFEIIDHLRDGVARRYWSDEVVQVHRSLCNRTIAALTRFIRWLRTHPDPEM